MPDGILDRFSMMYQFMFVDRNAIPDRLSLTDGEHVVPHIYSYEGSEIVDLPFMPHVMTQHHRLSSIDSGTSMEVWVAPVMRHLPIKVRFTDTSGAVTELTASSIEYTSD